MWRISLAALYNIQHCLLLHSHHFKAKNFFTTARPHVAFGHSFVRPHILTPPPNEILGCDPVQLPRLRIKKITPLLLVRWTLPIYSGKHAQSKACWSRRIWRLDIPPKMANSFTPKPPKFLMKPWRLHTRNKSDTATGTNHTLARLSESVVKATMQVKHIQVGRITGSLTVDSQCRFPSPDTIFGRKYEITSHSC